MKKTPFVTKQQVEEIVKKFPTPFHLYDEAGIRANAQAVPDAQGTLSGRDAWPGLVLRAAAQVAADAEAREAPSHDKLQPSLQDRKSVV